jgi:hypothetical protein
MENIFASVPARSTEAQPRKIERPMSRKAEGFPLCAAAKPHFLANAQKWRGAQRHSGRRTSSLGIVVAGFAIVGGIAFWRTPTGSAKTFSLLLQGGNALRMITVILIVVVATLLALIGKIEGAAVVGIVSGIVGYVLAGLERSKANEDEDQLKP